MFFGDRLTLDKPTRTSDGYMAVRARAARTGVYQYAGRDIDPGNEHGLRDQAVVHVLRDESTVFDKAAAHSFIGKPVTNDHPREAVTANNWRDHSRGTVMGAIRDGEHLAFDLLITDAAMIAAIDGGKRELSNGYDAGLEFGSFRAADGTECQARQTSIKGNHVAVVDAGRAGPSCRIGDVALCDAAPQPILDSFNKEKPVKTMLIDGLTVDISNADTAQATITTILAARDTATAKVTGLETQVATLTTDKATLEAKVVTLEKQVTDSKPTTAQLLDAAKAYSLTVGKAKSLGVAVTDTMDTGAIMKAVVDAKLGKDAEGWNDAQIAASFAALTKDVKADASAATALGTAIADSHAASFGADIHTLRDAARALN